MNEKVIELLETIEKNIKKLKRIYTTWEEAYTIAVPLIGKNEKSAVMAAGFLENYYTCLETIFLRISQFFENNLTDNRWHLELLEKMTLHLEGIRPVVVSEENYPRLRELLKFRHFRRYYFDLEYDWDRLEFLTIKLREAHPVVVRDLNRFSNFLQKLSSA